VLDLVLHLLPELLVERSERFVHQNELWLEHQCPRHGDPLLLASRKLRWTATGKILQLHHPQRLLDALVNLAS
jgi:hypothetical protein